MMSSKFLSAVFAMLGLCVSLCSANSIDDVVADTNIARQLHDLLGFNVRVANEVYGTGIPALPTGTIQATDYLVRAFTQGNKDSGISGFDAVKWVGQESKPLGSVRFNLQQDPSLWFGLSFQGNTVNSVLTVQGIYNKIQTWYFMYAFDQNQQGNTAQIPDSKLPGPSSPDPDWQNNYLGDGTGGYLTVEAPELEEDIWLKARVILVRPDLVAALKSKDAAGVATYVGGLTEGDGKMTFYMDDTIFRDYKDGLEFYSGLPNPGAPELARDWVHLAGTTYFDPTVPSNPYPNPLGLNTLTFLNNGSGSSGDWAGLVVDAQRNPVNFSQYAQWGYLLEVLGVYDNSGPEEIYIMGAAIQEEPTPYIPEPLTALALFGGLGGLGVYLRRRF